MNFPYSEHTDDELDYLVDVYTKQIHKFVDERNFEWIQSLGKTLIEIEKEIEQRRSTKH